MVGLSLIAAACATPPAIFSTAPEIQGAGLLASGCPQPAGGDFGTASPAQANMDPVVLARAMKYAAENASTSVRIYRHDCLVATSGLDPLTEASQWHLFSATKGVLSLVVGRAVTLGHLSVDDTVGQYFPEADAEHAAITVEQLLTQSSGLKFSWAWEVHPLIPNSIRYVLDLPFSHEPDTYYEYAQTTLTLLGELVTRAVGQDLVDFARTQLFEPIGISGARWAWNRDPAGHAFGYAYLSMAPLSLARLGSLMLNEGRWADRQLIDPGYMADLREPSANNPGYGYLVWTNAGEWHYTPSTFTRMKRDRRRIESAPDDLWAISGLGDQIVHVIPSLGLTVVRTGFPSKDGWLHEFYRHLLASLTDVEVPDPGPFPPEPWSGLTDWRILFDPQIWPYY